MKLLLAVAVLGGIAVPPFPGPGPEPAETIATFRARDLTGARHTVPDPTGLDRTLLVVADERHDPAAIEGWLEGADRYLPPGARTVLVVVADGDGAEDRVRALVPERYWGVTLPDRDGDLAAELGLVETRWPQVYALDEVGRVLLGYQGRADDPAARRVWEAIRPYPRPAWPVW